jgi:hypothetical protein
MTEASPLPQPCAARPTGELGRAQMEAELVVLRRRITGPQILSKRHDCLIAIASLEINLAIAATCVARDRQMAGYTGDRLMAACANRSEYVSGDNQPRVPNDPHPPLLRSLLEAGMVCGKGSP